MSIVKIITIVSFQWLILLDWVHTSTIHVPSMKNDTFIVPSHTRTIYFSPNDIFAPFQPTGFPQKFCDSSSCVRSAANMLSRMNNDAKPCYNFYEFACGNYKIFDPVPNEDELFDDETWLSYKFVEQMRSVLERPHEPTEGRATQILRDFYVACMNSSQINALGLRPMLDSLNMFYGGWPITLAPNQWDEQKWFNWSRVNFEYTMNEFIELDVMTYMPLQKNILKLDVSSGINSKEKINTENDEKYLRALIELFGVDANHRERDIQKVMQFKSTLNNEANQTYSEPKLMSVSDLSKLFPNIAWIDYINNLSPNVHVTDSELILVHNLYALERVLALVNQTDKDVVVNYAVWKSINNLLFLSSDQARQISLEFDVNSFFISDTPSKASECVLLTRHWLRIAADSLYVRSYVDTRSIKTEIKRMSYKIGISLRKMIISSRSISEYTKTNLVNKLKYIKAWLVYPDEILNLKRLNQLHEDLYIDRNRYLESSFNLTAWARNRRFRGLGKATDKISIWDNYDFPMEAGSFYYPDPTRIYIPAVLLQAPIFYVNRPKYLNYATIGAYIANQLMRAFDLKNIGLDINGNKYNWTDTKTEIRYNRNVECFISEEMERLKYYGLQSDIDVDDNIVNLMGAKVVYNVINFAPWHFVDDFDIKDGLPGLSMYNSRQLFWIAFTQKMCTKFSPISADFPADDLYQRMHLTEVNGLLRNLNEFAEAFSCGIGTPMNPTNKCSYF